MRVRFSPDFDKQFVGRLNARQQSRVLDTLELFQDQPTHKDLRNHALRDEWRGHHSISVDSDLRLHYKVIDNKTAYFVAVGSHKQLYK